MRDIGFVPAIIAVIVVVLVASLFFPPSIT